MNIQNCDFVGNQIFKGNQISSVLSAGCKPNKTETNAKRNYQNFREQSNELLNAPKRKKKKPYIYPDLYDRVAFLSNFLC